MMERLSEPTLKQGYRLLDVSPHILLNFLKEFNKGIRFSDNVCLQFDRIQIPEDAQVAGVWIDKDVITLKLESKEYQPTSAFALEADLRLPIEIQRLDTAIVGEKEKRTPHQERIEEFMRKAEQEVPEKPTIPSEEVRLLRAKLIMEECLETIRALGFSVAYIGDPEFDISVVMSQIEFLNYDCDVHQLVANGELHRPIEPNLVEIADGCADISVVTIGTLSACGIKDRPLLEEVDRSNLAKFSPGGYKRDDGKWCKSPDWQPPQIQRILDEQSGGESP